MIEVYRGGYQIVRKSGVGQAIRHQEIILKQMGLLQENNDDSTTEVVHINTVFPDSPIRARKAKRKGQKVIYYGHSTEEDFRNSFPGSNLFSPLFKKWIKHCYSLGDLIITPTPYSKGLLESYKIRKPIYAVSNGVDTDYFIPDENAREHFHKRLGVDINKKVVISVGHLIERKGIVEFIEVAKRMPDVLFLWYGFTPNNLIKRNVKKALKQIPSNLKMMGFVEADVLREAYQGCDAFLFLSKEETEGIVILEAMACETPVIVNDIPVFSGWLKDKDNVIKIKDSKKTIQIVNELLAQDNNVLRKNARGFALSRDYKQIQQIMKQIYTDEFDLADLKNN